jgi:hypothetical protein
MLKSRYPAHTADVPNDDLSPTTMMHKKEKPKKPAMSETGSTDTVPSLTGMRSNTEASKTTSSEEGPSEFKAATSEGALDTLTLIRSSLALASEQNPSILLCTLLKILTQFVRADYGGIAFYDETNPTVIRLRAAGQHANIVPYNLALEDETCQQLCPASIITQVARTGVVSVCYRLC